MRSQETTVQASNQVCLIKTPAKDIETSHACWKNISQSCATAPFRQLLRSSFRVFNALVRTNAVPSLTRIETKSIRIRCHLDRDDAFEHFGTFLPHSRISRAHWLHGYTSFCKHMSCIGCWIETKAQFCFNSWNASDNSAISAGPIARSHPTRFLSYIVQARSIHVHPVYCNWCDTGSETC